MGKAIAWWIYCNSPEHASTVLTMAPFSSPVLPDVVLAILRMASLYLCFLWSAAASAVDQSPTQYQDSTYARCSVFAASMCFGIAPGDKVVMEYMADFIVYRISLSSGTEATIYVGYNPEVGKDPGASFQNCAGLNGFGECKKRLLNNGSLEFVASRDQNAPLIHVVVSGEVPGKKISEAFINSVNACRRTGNAITCAP